MVALGLVVDDFEKGLIKINIIKILNNEARIKCGEILCDQNICYPICEKSWGNLVLNSALKP